MLYLSPLYFHFVRVVTHNHTGNRVVRFRVTWLHVVTVVAVREVVHLIVAMVMAS
jgi:hypothetical protein